MRGVRRRWYSSFFIQVKPGCWGTAHLPPTQGQYIEQILLLLFRPASLHHFSPQLLISCERFPPRHEKGRAIADTIITISNASLLLFDISVIILVDPMQKREKALPSIAIANTRISQKFPYIDSNCVGGRWGQGSETSSYLTKNLEVFKRGF